MSVQTNQACDHTHVVSRNHSIGQSAQTQRHAAPSADGPWATPPAVAYFERWASHQKE